MRLAFPSALAFAAVALALMACSSNDGTPTNGADAGGPFDSGVGASDTGVGSGDDGGVGNVTDGAGQLDAASDGGDDGGGSSASDGGDGGGNVTLTVVNYFNGCNVSINGSAPTNDAPLTLSVAPGTVVTLVATPANEDFAIGATPWFGIDQNDGGAASGTDVGSGQTESSTATVTLNASHCVSVCCDDDGTTDCPTTNQCP